MGAYCRFCNHRCFVERWLPPDAKWMPGQHVHLATCAKGAARDREQIGYDYSTALNPSAPALRAYVELVRQNAEQRGRETADQARADHARLAAIMVAVEDVAIARGEDDDLLNDALSGMTPDLWERTKEAANA